MCTTVYPAKLLCLTLTLSLFFPYHILAASESNDSLTAASNTFFDQQIISLSKNSDTIGNAATSIYVFTENDLHCFGASRLQDVLNMVPGFWFDELTYNYNVSALRSPARPVTQSVLVMVDGFPINSPLTAGIAYNFLDIPLSHIERIEIVKGMHGSMYGANANSGIINIITKRAKTNEGLHVTTDASSLNSFSPYVFYGQKLMEKMYVGGYIHYRTTSGYDKNPVFTGEAVNLTSIEFIGIPATTVDNKFTSNHTDGRNVYNAGVNFQGEFIKKLTASGILNFSYVGSKCYTASILKDTLPFVTNERCYDIRLAEQARYDFTDKHHANANMSLQYLDYALATGGGHRFKNMILNFEARDNIQADYNDLTFGIHIRSIGYAAGMSNENDINFRNFENTELLYAAFFNDKINYNDWLRLWLGIRAETWTLIGNIPNVYPTMRIAITPSKTITLWAAAAASTMSPGYIEKNIEFRKQQLPCVSAERAIYIANQQGLGGAARQQYLSTMAYYRSLLLPGTNELLVAVVPYENLKAPDYKTIEFGIKRALNPQSILDFSFYYTTMNNGIDTDTDYLSKSIIFSEVFDNQSIWPIYYVNKYKSNMWGGEILCKIITRKNIIMEISYSLFYETREGLPIPGSQSNTRYQINQPHEPETPMHILRFRPSLDISKYGLSCMAYILWASESDRGSKFNYVTQMYDPANGIYEDAPGTRIQLDLFFEKTFFRKNLRLYFYGKNLLVSHRVNYYSEDVPLGYPHTVHRYFGCGLHFNWNFLHAKNRK